MVQCQSTYIEISSSVLSLHVCNRNVAKGTTIWFWGGGGGGWHFWSGQIIYFHHVVGQKIYFRVNRGQNIYFQPQQIFEKAKKKYKNKKKGGGD